MRTHEVAKPFTCNICKQAFNVQSNFSAHMKTHNQKKPYPCSMCEKRFNDPLGFPFNALIMENLCHQHFNSPQKKMHIHSAVIIFLRKVKMCVGLLYYMYAVGNISTLNRSVTSV